MYFGNPVLALLHLVVSALSLLFTAYVVPGFKVKDFAHALIAAFVIGVANVFIYPILWFLTLPLNFLTLGLFTFVINAFILKMCAAVLKGFEINGWMSALAGALILALAGGLLHRVIA